MSEWERPETWANIVKTLAGAGVALAKLKEAFAKRRERRKQDERKINEAIDGLQKTVGKIIELMMTTGNSHRRFVEASANTFKAVADRLHADGDNLAALNSFAVGVGEWSEGITTIALGHERRIKALEAKAGKRSTRRKR
jgi:hypothetical protein